MLNFSGYNQTENDPPNFLGFVRARVCVYVCVCAMEIITIALVS